MFFNKTIIIMMSIFMILLCSLSSIFAAYGLTVIIVESDIVEPIRNILSPIPLLGKLVSCFMCTSVWVSAFVSFALYSITGELFLIGSTSIFWDAMVMSPILWQMRLYVSSKTQE